ncbi:alkaline phosphatase [Chondrinema litorale]|uniref:alkaline phosphatase n=1 Tax=Chondrinema litorale TaxID=2994555 RepID=UPI002543303B|nr:alkaline phosphatase [Chondrinema litorale]UZR97546.1 alkaline phosphatase [Chondrinema litorale]
MKRYFIILLSLFLLSNCHSPAPVETEIQSKELPKIKNIIFMIGDGMGLTQVYAGMTAKHGHLNLERCKHIGLVKTYSASSYITDSAAGATAYATGKKTYNAAIGVDADTIPQKSILKIAQENGLSTGLIATCTLTDATPACFVAHQPDRNMHEAIAVDYVSSDVDVLIGGGNQFFTQREDGQNLLEKFAEQGYQTPATIEEVKNIKEGKIAAFLAPKDLPSKKSGRGNDLADGALKAIELLNKNEKGFFLMVEASQIDDGGHFNDAEYIKQEMVDFDETIGKVLDFAEQDGETLVVITADHETGGFSIIDGDLKEGRIKGAFGTGGHSSVMVPAFAFGPGAEEFMGFYENTSIFNKFLAAFNFSL